MEWYQSEGMIESICMYSQSSKASLGDTASLKTFKELRKRIFDKEGIDYMKNTIVQASDLKRKLEKLQLLILILPLTHCAIVSNLKLLNHIPCLLNVNKVLTV